LNSVPINGRFNSAFGIFSFSSNTTGWNNSAFGYNSLQFNKTGNSNAAFGLNSLQLNISGEANVALGAGTLTNNIDQSGNTAIGHSSLANSNSSGNTAIGIASLYYNNSGSNNVAVGGFTLNGNISGNFNTAVGKGADVNSGSLTNATAIGYNAKVNDRNTMQFGNSAVTHIYAGTGTNATVVAGGLQITRGPLVSGHVLTSDAFGNATWQAPTTTGGGGNNWSLLGNSGTVDGINFIGTRDNVPLNFRVNNENAGKIDNFNENVLFGYQAGINFNTTAFNNASRQNVGIGHNALFSSQYSLGNVAIGFDALYSTGVSPSGSTGNVAVGWRSLYKLEGGGNNVAIGSRSLYNNQAEYNTAVGDIALYGNFDGRYNTAVGRAALGNNVSGTFITGLGLSANVSLPNLFNATAIGYDALVNANNKVVIGNNLTSIVIGGFNSWSNFSDGRFKENVKEDVPGLQFINKLRPVTYNFNTKKIEEHITKSLPDSVKVDRITKRNLIPKEEYKLQTGFIAQEVEITAKEIGYSFDGVNAPKNETDNYSLAYAQFTVPLVKAVQELSEQNDDLKKEMAELRTMISELKNNKVEGSINITEAKSEAKLYQNAPNPFSKSTTIRYSLSASSKRASITITNMEGIKIKTFELNNKNGETLNINGGELSAGTYIYTLIVDDVIVDSKKMILTK
jgi:trimeric autotransporter adhesin